MRKFLIINLYLIHLDLITALTGLNIDEKDDGKYVLLIRYLNKSIKYNNYL